MLPLKARPIVISLVFHEQMAYIKKLFGGLIFNILKVQMHRSTRTFSHFYLGYQYYLYYTRGTFKRTINNHGTVMYLLKRRRNRHHPFRIRAWPHLFFN